MTSESAERAFERHDAFTPADDGYDLTTTPFDVRATATTTDDDRAAFEVTVRLPTLDTVVADEAVPPVVEDGWYDTLALRLADSFDPTKTVDHEEPAVERRAGTVAVTFSYRSGRAKTGVEDAKVLAEFVEGTYVQGLIPGYDYEEPAGDLLATATNGGGGGL
ncbi:DUF5813 family protein [Haloarchaeobius iranensis]|uniref:Uncharacterized protein n=1 Tax=Haloarchaeobius iranensis TaxID=996166 RepID=A0A1H0AKY0_9EURY|nr:DUF5813 family protein [Haloarchaeobius iranensis]SDN34190.1 hypothetical protein SAMN05192554_1288 [Haloarchaeobius iranensis]